MGATVLRLVQGAVPEGLAANDFRDTRLLAGPPLALLVAVLLLGLWVPPPLRQLVGAAAALVGGR